jgi:biopolymer transport protein ExbD
MMGKRPAAGEVVPNLAPMVDVIMVLLIFFLCGTTLAIVPQGILQTELDPSGGPGQGPAIEINPAIRIGLEPTQDPRQVIVYLNERRLGVLEEKPFDDELLRRRGRKAALEDYFGPLYVELGAKAAADADLGRPVVIGAPGNVRWKFVIKAMDAVGTVGFKNVQFAVSFAETTVPG